MRTKINKIPSAILCSDIHLREDIPTCWTGDFLMEQWIALQCISNLQKEFKCPVIHAGDLFHHWKPSPWLLSIAIKHLPEQFYTIYGQHDLPQHNWELRHKSGIYTLQQAGRVKILVYPIGVNWGQEPSKDKNTVRRFSDKDIVVWHHLTYQQKPFPGATGGMAAGILRKYPQFDLIVTGDNHQSFVEEYQGRLLVNPGCMTRQDADQIDFKPRIALWYAEDNTIEWRELPIQEGVISREHLEVKKERDSRIEAFISKLNDEYNTSLSFEENLERFQKKNKVQNDVMLIIYKSLEYGKSKNC